MYLAFNAIRNLEDGNITYNFSKGKDEESLSKESNKFESRYYLKTLNMEYVKSNRNLQKFIQKEKKNLLIEMMNRRNEMEKSEDSKKIEIVKNDLDNVNSNVRSLSYIKNATNIINVDLENLSTHNRNQSFQFSTITQSIDDIQNNVELVSNINNRELSIGGDGRNNQIFMSLWCNKYNTIEEKSLNVTIYCIEEPEAHLHPHQQRQLSKFLLNLLNEQVIISTHSPQIASEFEPSSVIRLYNNNYATAAANNGCSEQIEDAIMNFGYRMNIIAAEAFFSKVVFLVEGPSEYIFYKTLAHELNINLDRYGVSIIDVNGVGFSEYMRLLKSLNIKYVFRTDNDIFKIPKKELYRCSGIQRAINLYRMYYDKCNEIEEVLKRENELNNLPTNTLNEVVEKLSKEIINKLEKIGIFLAEIDLENDIYNSGIDNELKSYYKTTSQEETVDEMKSKKAINLYNFLKNNQGLLIKLKGASIAKPLYKCIEMSESNE